MRMAAFDIADNGMGIEPEKQYLLFKPFSQVSVCLRLKCMHVCLSVCLYLCLFSVELGWEVVKGLRMCQGSTILLTRMASRG